MKKFIAFAFVLSSIGLQAQTTNQTPTKFVNGLLIPNLSSAPMIGAGSMWYNPSTNKISFYNVATSSWQYVLSENLAAATYPTLTGGGASGNWNINILGNANSASAIAWSGITSKPTTITGYGLTDAVPFGRTLTINGVAYDLSTNRSWVITETDPTVPSFVKSITSTNISNWNTAYGWGNHAGLYVALIGDQNVSGYKRFLGNIGVGSNIYGGSGTWTNSFGSPGVQWNNTDDVATTSRSFAMNGGVDGDWNLWVSRGTFPSNTPYWGLNFSSANLTLNYPTDVSANYTDRSLVDKGYVDSRAVSGLEPVYGPANFSGNTLTLSGASFASQPSLVVYADCSSAAKTVVLPSLSQMANRKVVVFKMDSSSNVVTVTYEGETNINGSPTYTITTQYNSVEIRSRVGFQYYAR